MVLSWKLNRVALGSLPVDFCENYYKTQKVGVAKFNCISNII